MRIAIFLLCAALGACKSKDKPPAPSPTPTPTAGSGSASASGSGSSAPTNAEAPKAAPTGVPAKLDKPLAVIRKHASGEKYKVHMDRDSTEFGLTTFDATATVTEAAGSKATFEVDVNIASKDGTPVNGAKLTMKADFGDRPHIDAEPTGGPDVELYLTPLEHLMGDLCTPPKTAHIPGDAWKENVTDWKFASYTSVDDGFRATFEGKSSDGWLFSLSLSPTDGFTGTCSVNTGDTTWKLQVTRQ